MRRFYLFVGTTLLLIVSVIRLLATSASMTLRNAAAPYAILEIPFFAIGVFFWLWAWTDRPRLSLILAAFAAVGFWIASTGAVFA